MEGLKNFNRSNFSFPGIYRGVVEDNADPLDVGRLRVRIREIHSIDGNDIPVEQLPWAEPAIGLYWSGGKNILNRDHKADEEPDKPEARYNPNPPAPNPKPPRYPKENGIIKKGASATDPTVIDEYGNACGTGGFFTVPKRGNWVFLFFENGNHMKPIYFAMAPNKKDWDFQKDFRDSEISNKIKQLKEFKEEFEPRKEVKGKGWASDARVNSLVDKPKFNILPVNDVGPNTNRDITCMTSLNGTTIVIDNRLTREQIFIIHKNCMEYTDTEGNKKFYVGKSRGHTQKNTNDPDTPSNYEVGVEGNHSLHVFGNYDIYSHGRTNIQCDEHVQIDAKKSVGIVSREGDVDIIVEKGSINADVQSGDINVNVASNFNAQINGNANIKVDKNMKATVGQNADIKVGQSTKLTSSSLDVKCTGKVNIEATDGMDITTNNLKISGNLHVGGFARISRTCDIGQNTTIGSILKVSRGIDCGGYLYNSGMANLGSPVIANGLQVQIGQGSGTGGTPTNPDSPSNANSADEASQEKTSTGVDKTFENNSET